VRTGARILICSLALIAAGESRLDVLIFIATDCPISNAYAPEIARICKEYGPQGARCELVYPDPPITDEAVRLHQNSYGLADIHATADRDYALAKQAGATVTPEAAVLQNGRLVYRGRIDDRYVTWGKSRPQAGRRDLRRALDELIAGKAVSAPRTRAVGCYIPFTAPKLPR
jgi:hypothetical protein